MTDWTRPTGRIRPILRKATFMIPSLAFLCVVLRHLYVLSATAVVSQESVARTLIFAITGFSVLAAPGLFALRHLRIRYASPFEPAVLVFSTSIGCSMMVFWGLYVFDGYTRVAASAYIAISAFFGLLSVLQMPKAKILRFCRLLAPSDITLALIAILFCEAAFEASAGTPLRGWDAVVSWDKWAVAAASRTGLGRYVFGAYPQGLPGLTSFFYKLDPWGDACDMASLEHVLVGGYLAATFAVVAAFSILSLSRRFGVAGWIGLAFFVGNFQIRRCCFGDQVGYADLPCSALLLAGFSMTFLATDDSSRGFRTFSLLLIPVYFASLFIKGNSMVLLPSIAVACLATRGWRGSKAVFVSLAVSGLLVGTFFLHQWFFGVWNGEFERNLFNHSLQVKVAHTYLFETNLAHAWECLAKLVNISPRNVKTVGLSVAACCVALTAISLIWRRTASVGIVFCIAIFFWWRTASYGIRNAVFAISLVGLLGEIAVFRIPSFSAKAIMSLFALLVSAWWVFPQLKGMFQLEYPSGKSPLRIGKVGRMDRFSPMRPIHHFAVETPWGLRAEHIVEFGTGYRWLSGKGVYPMQMNATTGGFTSGDLAFSKKRKNGRVFVPKSPFVPVSRIKGMPEETGLFIYAPDKAPVDFSVQGSTLKLDVDLSGGFVCIDVKNNPNQFSIRQKNPPAVAVPYLNVLLSTNLAESILVPFWNSESKVLEFEIIPNETRAEITGVSVLH